MWSIGVYVVAFIIVLLTKWIYRWRNPKCNGILPPGSSGIPLIGESLELIIPTNSIDIHPFLKKRLQRYGPLFRTNVAGRNVVVSADQEFNLYLFQQEEKLVVHWYLDLFAKLFKQGEFKPDGLSINKYIRNLVLSHFGVDCIKKNLLSQFEELVHRTLHSWSIQDSIELESAFVAMFGEFGAKQLYSYNPEISKELTDKFISISRGAMSFPLNVPGTTYYKCIKNKMWSVGVCVAVAFTIIFLTQWIHRWRNPKCNGILPPGSLGIPLIGESLELIIPNYSIDIHPFLKKRLQRYGPLFRTNVAGRNVVVSADQEFNHFLFQQEEKLVVRWYLDLFAKLFKQGEFRPDGLSIHKYMKNLVLNHVGIDCIKQNLLSQIEELVNRTLHSWSIQDSIELESAFAAMSFEFGAKLLFSYDPESSKELMDNFINAIHGAMSFPLKIPGTTYYKCLKNKEKVLRITRDIVDTRLASPQTVQDDLLSKVIKDMNTVNFITQEYITQLIFSLLSATFLTVPFMSALAVKFISENPAVLQELIAEHDEILRKRQNSDSSVTWEEYKSMTFTLQVINETLRLGNVFPGFLRKAVKDINVKGYTIPAGWGIMACQSVAHLDPNLYKDPLKFDPWRWKDIKSEFISKNLKPFGGGIKQCSGADLSKAIMCIFLHVLVTKYRWAIVKGGDIVQKPIKQFKNGFYISVSERRD